MRKKKKKLLTDMTIRNCKTPKGNEKMTDPQVNTFWTVDATQLSTNLSDMDAITSSQADNPHHLQLFWRSNFESYRVKLDKQMVQPIGKVFTGPAGAGKSCMLYALAQYAITHGYLVLYLNLKEICSMPANLLAEFVLDTLQSTNKGRWAEHPEDLQRTSEERAEYAITRLRTGRDPVCICLDQWNAVLDTEATPYFKKLFGHFRNVRVLRTGATFLAVSSSFSWPHECFDDADGTTHREYVPLYREEEFRGIVDHLRAQGKLPREGMGLSLGDIERLCGRVGRMLYCAQLAWNDRDPHDRTHWDARDAKRTKELAVYYYGGRVKSLLKRALCETDAAEQDERHAIMWFTANLFLNKGSACDMPSAFEWAGLFDSSAAPPSPACPAVMAAIYKELVDCGRAMLTMLSQRSATRGTALELFVETGFRRGPFPREINVVCTNLNAREETRIRWTISNVRVQSRSDLAACLDDIVEGTLIVCVEGHAVVDMVLYCNASVYFIQISCQSYKDHATKIDDLVRCAMPHSGRSVGEFYTARAPAEWSVPVLRKAFTTEICARVKFVYCTPDNTAHDLSKSGRAKHVLRIGYDKLSAFGSNYDLFL